MILEFDCVVNELISGELMLFDDKYDRCLLCVHWGSNYFRALRDAKEGDRFTITLYSSPAEGALRLSGHDGEHLVFIDGERVTPVVLTTYAGEELAAFMAKAQVDEAWVTVERMEGGVR